MDLENGNVEFGYPNLNFYETSNYVSQAIQLIVDTESCRVVGLMKPI